MTRREAFEIAGQTLASILNQSAPFPPLSMFEVLHDIVLEYLPQSCILVNHLDQNFTRERLILIKSFKSVTLIDEVRSAQTSDLTNGKFVYRQVKFKTSDSKIQTIVITQKDGFAVISLNKNMKYELVKVVIKDDIVDYLLDLIGTGHEFRLHKISQTQYRMHAKVDSKQRSKSFHAVVRRILKKWPNFLGSFVNEKRNT
jgi:hypothetical protein